MKKYVLLLILTSCFLLLTNPASAHMPGQPSFFIVNGKYADFYPWPSGKLPNPDEPQDIAPEQYRVNQPITFEIDFTKFPQASSEQIKKTKFYWKYGDGNLGNGTKNTYTYKQAGKYILTIMAKDDTMPTPQLFESIEITIVPDEREKVFPYAIIAGIIIMIIGGLFTYFSMKRRK